MSIVLIATGGTIACTQDSDGALVPTKSAADLVPYLETDKEVRPIDFRHLDSSAITLEDLDELVELVEKLSAEEDVERIIITHGTDSMEETAMALSLFHSELTPVILTGAQRPYDHPEADGPANLRAAASIDGFGVIIQFGGVTTHAWGARKEHLQALDAFGSAEADFPEVVPLPIKPLAGKKVGIVVAYPGAGRDAIDVKVAKGYEGLVIKGLGSGNVSPEMGDAIVDALKAGVQVVITSRVPNGEVQLIYGGPGGGATLARHGAVGSGVLHAGQSRIVLAAALATGINVSEFFS